MNRWIIIFVHNTFIIKFKRANLSKKIDDGNFSSTEKKIKILFPKHQKMFRTNRNFQMSNTKFLSNRQKCRLILRQKCHFSVCKCIFLWNAIFYFKHFSGSVFSQAKSVLFDENIFLPPILFSKNLCAHIMVFVVQRISLDCIQTLSASIVILLHLLLYHIILSLFLMSFVLPVHVNTSFHILMHLFVFKPFIQLKSVYQTASVGVKPKHNCSKHSNFRIVEHYSSLAQLRLKAARSQVEKL